MIRVAFFSGTVLQLMGASAGHAQTVGDDERSTTQAVRIGDEDAPTLDGRLDDEAWQRVHFLSDFTTKEPVEGGTPLAGTDVAFVYTGEALYIGARMHNAQPWDARPFVTRRDEFAQSEVVVFSLDTFLDRRTAYAFATTVAGGRVDYYNSSDAEHSRDMAYDPVWETSTSVDEAGWTAEMRIPFSQLRFNDREVQTWGLNINRWIPERNEDIYWVLIPKNEQGWSSRFGDLVGIEDVSPSRGVELLPYLASETRRDSDPDVADPFQDGSETVGRVGADLKIGLGPNLTLDATFNPDFGQVEADPAEVNLTDFETFFSERRPFFLEGADLLRSQHFYSRRIGAPPRGSAPGDFVDRPDNTTILGAAKLSGRLTRNLSIGALAALTGREHAQTFDIDSGTFDEVEVEPLGGYAMVRALKQFGPDQSTMGFTLTGVRRDVTSGEPLAGQIAREAYTGGLDWGLRFRGGQYGVSGNVGFSHVRGDPEFMTVLQNRSARYFGRPDADHVRLDPTAESMSGYNLMWRVEKIGGRHWLWNLWGEFESPGFEQNEMGRLTAGDDIDVVWNLLYRENQPGSKLYNYTVGTNGKAGWNYGGTRQATTFGVSADLTWVNYLSTGVNVQFDARALDDKLTRGGPLMERPQRWLIQAHVQSDRRQTKGWTSRVQYQSDELGGWVFAPAGGFWLRPSGRWSLSVNPAYRREVNPRQYLWTLDGGGNATFGQRYLFAFIERSTLSAQIRLDYSVNPDLTVELYAEPFASSGRYYDVGELSAASTGTLRTYGTDGTMFDRGDDGSLLITDGPASFSVSNPNFNVRSYRSNLVLRWEWTRGSTLFLVWQQDRSQRTPEGRLVRPVDLWDSFSEPGRNVFALKINYWLLVR
jgi:hypothetical protein